MTNNTVRSERDLLRAYAKEPGGYVKTAAIPGEFGYPTERLEPRTRGEAAGGAFVALQNVLDYLDSVDRLDVAAAFVSGLRNAIRQGLE